METRFLATTRLLMHLDGAARPCTVETVSRLASTFLNVGTMFNCQTRTLPSSPEDTTWFTFVGFQSTPLASIVCPLNTVGGALG